MAGLAVGIVLVILLVGQPNPPTGASTASVVPQVPNADRVRDYQDRLRALEAQALRELQAAEQAANQAPPMYIDEPAQAPEDPIAADRRRREYESLFASNVAVSRRPENERPDAGLARPSSGPVDPGMPSVDEVADAVMRAATRAGGTTIAAQQPIAVESSSPAQAGDPSQRRTPEVTGPIRASGPLHLLLEGTLIDTVLTNRLDGSMAAPVNLLVTNPIYSHSGHQILVPLAPGFSARHDPSWRSANRASPWPCTV